MTDWSQILGIAIGIGIFVLAFVIYEVTAEIRFRRQFRREGEMLSDAFGRWAANPTEANKKAMDLAAKIARHEPHVARNHP